MRRNKKNLDQFFLGLKSDATEIIWNEANTLGSLAEVAYDS